MLQLLFKQLLNLLNFFVLYSFNLILCLLVLRILLLFLIGQVFKPSFKVVNIRLLLLSDFFKLLVVPSSALCQLRLHFATCAIQIIVQLVLSNYPMLHGLFLNQHDIGKLFVHNLNHISLLLIVWVIDISLNLWLEHICLFSDFLFTNFQNKQGSVCASWEDDAWIVGLKETTYSAFVDELFVHTIFSERME